MTEGPRLGNLSWLDIYSLCSGWGISRLGYWVSKGLGLHQSRAEKWEVMIWLHLSRWLKRHIIGDKKKLLEAEKNYGPCYVFM